MRVFVGLAAEDYESDEVIAVATTLDGCRQQMERVLRGEAESVAHKHRNPDAYDMLRIEEWDLDGEWRGFHECERIGNTVRLL